MISARYSIHEFLDAVQGKSVFEAISMAQHECYEAEQMTRGGKRGAPAARAAGCDRYAADLKGFIFFLSNGVQPAGIDNGTFISLNKTRYVKNGHGNTHRKLLRRKVSLRN